jgi:hypothetical protein
MAINDFEEMVLCDSPPQQPSSAELQSNPHQEAEIVNLRDALGSHRREISMFVIMLTKHIFTIVTKNDCRKNHLPNCGKFKTSLTNTFKSTKS